MKRVLSILLAAVMILSTFGTTIMGVAATTASAAFILQLHPLYQNDGYSLAEMEGFDLPCGAGRVAALTCPRHVIHYRSRSNP